MNQTFYTGYIARTRELHVRRCREEECKSESRIVVLKTSAFRITEHFSQYFTFPLKLAKTISPRLVSLSIRYPLKE